MDFLPKLSAGIQRAGCTDRTDHSRTVTVAQASTLNLAQRAGDVGAEPPLLSGGGFTSSALALPIYGNYCGPHYGDSTGCGPAQDQVDSACCRHDVCYGERGYFNCKCDCDLVRIMGDAIVDTSSVAGKDAGAALMALAATSPCVAAHIKVCIPGTDRCKSVPILYPGGLAKCLVF